MTTPVPPPGLLHTAAPSAAPTEAVVTRIVGRIVDADGLPLSDAGVALVEGPQAVPPMAYFSDIEGRYEWRVAPGTYTIEVYRDGYAVGRGEATVGAGETVTLDFVLEKR